MTAKNKFSIFSRSTDKSQRMPKQDLDAISRAYPDDENEVNLSEILKAIGCAINVCYEKFVTHLYTVANVSRIFRNRRY